MGNRIPCLYGGNDIRSSKGSSERKAESKAAISEKKMRAVEEEVIQQQLIAMELHQQKKAQIKLERAASQRQPNSSSHLLPDKVPRSASVRGRSAGDPLVDRHQFLNGLQEKGLSLNLESRHFVLVHGGGNGAWCWYKSIALLEDSGLKATAIDLMGSGIDSTDPNSIISLAQYVKPLTSFLENLAENEKVVLVGHDFGGACISYAMENFPRRISKAVFVTAAMIANGQRAFDVFSQELPTSDDLLKKAQLFIYGKGNSNPPTAIEFDKSLMKDLFFNQSPAKDVALANVSTRPVPFAPVLEKLTLTAENYGSIRRFFVETTDDRALTPALQERIINLNPPERVFKLKGSDHSPFFSKPQALHKVLLEIAQLDARKATVAL